MALYRSNIDFQASLRLCLMHLARADGFDLACYPACEAAGRKCRLGGISHSNAHFAFKNMHQSWSSVALKAVSSVTINLIFYV